MYINKLIFIVVTIGDIIHLPMPHMLSSCYLCPQLAPHYLPLKAEMAKLAEAVAKLNESVKKADQYMFKVHVITLLCGLSY